MEKVLPIEILSEIISRLPLESVLDCRLVCKTWLALISLPSFALLHLQRALPFYTDDEEEEEEDDNGDEGGVDDQKYQTHSYDIAIPSSKVNFVALIQPNDEKKCQLYYGEYDDDDEQHKKKIIKINFPTFNFESYVIGSCNGLICLSIRHHHIHDPVLICNPITREHVYLPSLSFETIKKPSGFGIHPWGYIQSGFGYHHTTKEYKVIRIYNGPSVPSGGQVQVYTLGSGTGWRNKGEIGYDLKHTYGCKGACFANGAFHWRVHNVSDIVYFNLVDEEFRLLPPPPCDPANFYLVVLGGLLCAVDQKDVGGSVKIWSWKTKKNTKKSGGYNLMKDPDYQSWSWSLEFVMDSEDIIDFMEAHLVSALTKSGKVLVWGRFSGVDLYGYNLKTKVRESLVNYFHHKFRMGHEPVLHINSFISLKALGEDAKIIGSADGMIETDSPESNDYVAADELIQCALS